MKHYTLLILLGLGYITVFGQNKITGKILEKHTNTPIPGVNVQVLPSGKGAASNIQGTFTLHNLPLDCKLYFTAIGFKDTLVDASHFKNSGLLHLTPQAYALPELCVYPKKMRQIKLGISWYTDINGEIHSHIGWQYSTYFPNQKRSKGYINTFSLKIPPTSRWDCPFKIRIMKVDTTFQTIGIPMLPKDIVVKATSSGWCKVDLAAYKLPIPKDGFIVSIIIYDAGDDFFYKKKHSRGFTINYGIGMYMTSHPHEGIPWGYDWNKKRFGNRILYRNYYYAVRTTLQVI